jgi:hypothetical protein
MDLTGLDAVKKATCNFFKDSDLISKCSMRKRESKIKYEFLKSYDISIVIFFTAPKPNAYQTYPKTLAFGPKFGQN